jgi:CBS domain-containing protein
LIQVNAGLAAPGLNGVYNLQRKGTAMKAFDIMTRHVRTASPATPVLEIAQMLVKYRISGVPVVDDKNHVVGVVSEGDLLRRRETGTERQHSWWVGFLSDTQTLAREYAKSHGVRADEVMTSPAITIGVDTDLATIAKLFESQGIKRAPVVHDGKLVGIISRRDLVRLLAERLAGTVVRKVEDNEIRAKLAEALDRTPWGATAFVNADVHDGEVELHGLVASEDHRHAVRVMAENLDGVRRVKDDMQVSKMPRTVL